jgi:hypothetical protein
MSPELLEELIEQSTNWGGVEQNWLKPTILNLSNIDFWAYVVHHFDQIRVEQDILRYLVSLGIPGPLRGLLWQLFTHSKEQVNEKKYRQLVKLSSPHEKWIQRDLSRTFPKLDYFKERKGRDLLYNVIKAYSICDEQVGYCQGIHFIVGCLLLHVRLFFYFEIEK